MPQITIKNLVKYTSGEIPHPNIITKLLEYSRNLQSSHIQFIQFKFLPSAPSEMSNTGQDLHRILSIKYERRPDQGRSSLNGSIEMSNQELDTASLNQKLNIAETKAGTIKPQT